MQYTSQFLYLYYSGLEGISYFPEHYIFYGNRNELRDFDLNNTQ